MCCDIDIRQSRKQRQQMIVALAGRRVDTKEQDPPRFPSAAESVELVWRRIRENLLALQPSDLVSSAACGVDLLGLGAAGELGFAGGSFCRSIATDFELASDPGNTASSRRFNRF